MNLTEATRVTDQLSYPDLFARWERSQWSATDLDWERDRQDWRALDPARQRALSWNCSLFLHGDSQVTDTISALVAAAPTQESRIALSTQQSDEARHTVLFSRFMSEVCGVSERAADAAGATRLELPWGFARVLELLDGVSRRLDRRRSKVRLAETLTLYHLVIEAGMAQNTLERVGAYLERSGVMPTLAAAIHDVNRDEQRHIAIGMKLLGDLGRDDQRVAAGVAGMLRRVSPFMAASATPPGWDTSHATLAGYTLEELFAGSQESMEVKLRSAGLPPDRLPGPPPFPRGLTPAETAQRTIALLRAGVLGPPGASSDPGAQANGAGPPQSAVAQSFDLIARLIDLDAVPSRGLVLAWHFTDREPWHLRLTPSAVQAMPGAGGHADVRFRCSFGAWADLLAGRESQVRLLASGRLRVSGRPRALLHLPRLLGR